MVPGEDHHVFSVVATNNVEVLRHRIRRAAIPVFTVHALLSGQQIDKLIHLFAEEGPAALDVLHQGMGLILGDHADAADARVKTVRKGKIDDTEFTTEVDGGFGALNR
ncbi:hypothetical protein D3C79_968590 [compost metagenome]